MGNSKVVIKSSPAGLKILLDNTCEFNELVSEIKIRLSESKGFFKGSVLPVSFMNRELTDEEQNKLAMVMEQCGDFRILCVVSETENGEIKYKKMLKNLMDAEEAESGLSRYVGCVHSEQTLEFPKDVTIYGDVEPGAVVKAGGDVVVLGGIYGVVMAGGDQNTNHFIFAMEMSAEKIMIGKYRYYSTEKPKWSIRPKVSPKIAMVADDKICVNQYSTDFMKEYTNV